MASTKWTLLLAIVSVFVGFSARGSAAKKPAAAVTADADATSGAASDVDEQFATFAGGCFWCMEPPFEKLTGVLRVESGYTGGFVVNPTYEQVSHTNTGHVEAVRVAFDANRVRYEDLLEVFWRNINPTDGEGQFNDRGSSYLTAIFAHDAAQRELAEASKKRLGESGRFKRPIVTPILDAMAFYLAEDYHQDYYKKSAIKYRYYRYRSGRDSFLTRVWGKDRQYSPPAQEAMTGTALTKAAAAETTRTETAPTEASLSDESSLLADADGDQERRVYSRPSQEEIKKKLSRMQYRVTQAGATEPAFRNPYWDNKSPGIYVDVVTGEPLFSSRDKFEAGTGWPSFVRPLVVENIVTRADFKLLAPRTEVRSKFGDSHLGHVFSDGPPPTGLRYCLNSAALKFIPADKLKEEGYGEFSELFGE